MQDVETINAILRYSDWANERLATSATGLQPQMLDRVFDIGLGTLRRTLLHILAGETVWVQRWHGRRETPWPDEHENVSPMELRERFRRLIPERDRFLQGLKPADLTCSIVYRDSKGSLFSATLSDMLIQMCLHSTHHRAQAVNIFRQLGAEPPELDYMMWVRQPAGA